jgi:hypothetical protein
MKEVLLMKLCLKFFGLSLDLDLFRVCIKGTDFGASSWLFIEFPDTFSFLEFQGSLEFFRVSSIIQIYIIRSRSFIVQNKNRNFQRNFFQKKT